MQTSSASGVSTSSIKWRHVKSGGLYEVIASGILQVENKDLDDRPAVIYKGEDGRIWIRPFQDFYDGRFVVEHPKPDGSST